VEEEGGGACVVGWLCAGGGERGVVVRWQEATRGRELGTAQREDDAMMSTN
jgi:hypothetical protein